MPEIIFEQSGWWFLPIFIVSALLTLWLYGKGTKLPRPQKIVLAALRFSIFFILGILLLSPLIKQEEERLDKPILVWLEDRSLSMISGPDSTEVKAFDQRNKALKVSLEEKYQVSTLSFSTGLTEKTDSFNSAGTNLENAFKELQDRYYNRNLAGTVLISDGIYNQGSDPSFLAEQLSFPVYGVITGDSTKRPDLLIERVVHNKLSYVDNEFPVEVYVRGRALAGGEYRIKILDPKGVSVVNKAYSIDSEDYFRRESFYLVAKKEGFQRYTVILESESAADPTANNTSVFSIEVLSNRKKILLLASAPDPDLAAIGSALNSAKRYEITTQIGTTVPDNSDYDLIILHQPSPSHLKAIENSDVPYWLFLGESSRTDNFEPITTGNKGFEQSQVYQNREFDLFSLSDQELKFITDLPPIWAPFGTPVISGEYYPLMYKRIGNIKTLDPSWLFRYDQRLSSKERRSCIVLGTGLWRWRMHAYRTADSFEPFDQFILKTTQFLTTRSRTDRFDVNLSNRFGRSERIIGEARLYNTSLELVNDPDASIEFTAESGEKYDFALNRTVNTYRVNAGKLPPGVYSWSASVTLGDENLQDAGKLLVEEELRELSDLVSRPEVLQKIADASGGAVFNMNETEALQAALLNNPEAKAYRSLEVSRNSIIENKWPFILLLVLMTLEWGLRKYFGRY